MPRVAVLPLARPTFDVPHAETVAAAAFATLDRLGLDLVGPRHLLMDAAAVEAALDEVAGGPLDLVLLLQVTFTDAAAAVLAAERLDSAPVALWAFPEPRSGGRLRLNSLCGINLAAHSLGLAGRRCHHLHLAPDDPAAAPRLRSILDGRPFPETPADAAGAEPDDVEAAAADTALGRLRGRRLGRIGEHPPGFPTCGYDPDLLRRSFGVEVDPIERTDVFARARAVDPGESARLRERAAAELDGLDAVDAAATDRSLALYAAFRDTARERDLAGLAVRCWPEPFTELGCAACRPMGMLTEEGVPAACEADVPGALTSLLLQELAGEPAWLVDLVDLDPADGTGVVWHCGLAPATMCDPDVRPRADIHSNRRLPLLAAFPLKPGRITLARLSRARNRPSLVLLGGEVVAAPPSFSGTSGVIRFDTAPDRLLDRIVALGLEHHLSLAYGDHRPALRAVAARVGLPAVEL